MLDVMSYDFTGRLESFDADFSELLRRFDAPDDLLSTVSEVVNPTTKMYHAAAFDRELADCVYEVYRADFEAFGYDRDSWLFDF